MSRKNKQQRKRRVIRRKRVGYVPRNRGLGLTVRRTCLHRDIIYTTTTSSGAILFKNNTLKYRNIGDILNASADFQSMFTNYSICKIDSILVKVARIVTDAKLNTIGIGVYPVFIAFYPGLTGSAVPNAYENENAARISGLAFNEKSIMFKTVSVQSSNEATYYNPRIWFPTTDVNYLPGQFTIGWLNTTTTSANTDLYSINFYFNCVFGTPY